MAEIFVKATEPCIYEDGLGNVVDMSNTEFYGDENWQGIDPKTKQDVSKPRKANPGKIFKVVDSKYWLDLITKKKLVQVEKPRKSIPAAKEDKNDEKDD